MRTLFLAVVLGAICFSAVAQTTLTLPRKTQTYFIRTDVSPPTWMLGEVHTHTYNAQGQETERVSTFNGRNRARTVKTYSNFQLQETTHQFWSMVMEAWIDEAKAQYQYDQQGRVTSLTMLQDTGTGNPVNDARELFYYTGDAEKPETILRQDWRGAADGWVDIERSTNYVWSTDPGNPVGFSQFDFQEYNATTNAWVNDLRVSATYDPAARTLTIAVDTATSSTTWVNWSRNVTTYDEQMHETSQLSYQWTNGAWAFINGLQYQLTYNANRVLVEKITRQQKTEGAPLVDLFREVYSEFQTFVVTGAGEQRPEASLVLYPNPTADNLEISLRQVAFKEAQVQVVTLQGQYVYEATVSSRSITGQPHVISLQHLPAGTYILHLKLDSNQEISRRVVKQ
ncbi:T9SS type A sorting domain-containing protein [Rufibacter psychrotolerans]|uniref:T9SS type A sorting domain-containing protein n=1 Tax=Rufibacter psychrotolerans TaxID=2812556 RepID=UPI0019674EB0|nr:T9SS type A sorting domain-containing protein [Rufibacter sp. SYSU D00308]